MLNDVINNNLVEILDTGIKVFLLVLSGIVTFASTRLPGMWRAKAQEATLAAEEKLRLSLHSAAVSGVEAGKRMGLTGLELVAFAMKHIVKSVPDAVVGLTPTPAELIRNSPVDEIVNRLPTRARQAIENIVRAKIGLADPDDGWRAPHIPTGPAD
jgi:uncharacterized protein YjeT (DUF2065 family)